MTRLNNKKDKHVAGMIMVMVMVMVRLLLVTALRFKPFGDFCVFV